MAMHDVWEIAPAKIIRKGTGVCNNICIHPNLAACGVYHLIRFGQTSLLNQWYWTTHIGIKFEEQETTYITSLQPCLSFLKIMGISSIESFRCILLFHFWCIILGCSLSDAIQLMGLYTYLYNFVLQWAVSNALCPNIIGIDSNPMVSMFSR